MFLIFEVFFLGWVLLQAVQIVRDGWARTVIRLAVLVLAFGGSTLLFAVAGWLLPSFTGNVVSLAAAAVLVGIVGFYAIGIVADIIVKRKKLDERLRQRLKLNRLAGAAVTAFFLGAFLLAAALFMDAMVNLAGAGRYRQMIVDQTLVAKHLLRPLPAAAPADPETPPAPPAGGLARLRQSVSDRTGIQQVVTMLAVVDEFNRLPMEDRRWLVENTPELKRLLDNKAIHQVLESEGTMGLVDQLTRGDLTALFKLGEDANIRNLFTDQELRDAINAIDLLELRRRVRERQAETAGDAAEEPVPAEAPADEPAPEVGG